MSSVCHMWICLIRSYVDPMMLNWGSTGAVVVLVSHTTYGHENPGLRAVRSEGSLRVWGQSEGLRAVWGSEGSLRVWGQSGLRAVCGHLCDSLPLVSCHAMTGVIILVGAYGEQWTADCMCTFTTGRGKLVMMCWPSSYPHKLQSKRAKWNHALCDCWLL